MKGIDSHCHLDFEQFDEDREQVVQRTEEKLEMIVNPGANPEHNKKSYKLSKEFPNFVKFNTGLHPVYTDDFDSIETVKKQVTRFEPPAIGEIGLDHHHVEEPDVRRKQRRVFEEMLELAENKSLPVVLHTRDAEGQVLDILENYSLEDVFLHCFNGSPEEIEYAMDQGYFVGVTTQVLYSKSVQELTRFIDLDRLLLETDSPYLYRGSRNEPLNILESAEKIAEIKNIDKKEVLQVSSKNSRNFFTK